MDIEPIKEVALRSAYRAGEILKSHFGHLTSVTKKGAIDLVTVADIEAEKAIVETVRARFPEHAILAEESGAIDGDENYRWIIDPLDGTTNFAHNLSFFAVSIAFALEDELMLGIVFNPIDGEMFIAIKGRGAQLNNQPIQVTARRSVRESLLVTGFPYEIDLHSPSLMNRFSNFLTAAQGVRRLGSAALDLCYVACGRFEGFWEENLNPWDTAAGVLLVEEAGGKVTDFRGARFHIDKKQILATNGQIHREMISLLLASRPVTVEDEKWVQI